MQQFQFRVGHDNFGLIHVSLVPDMHGEQKAKPTQTTIHSLCGLGLLLNLIAHRLLGLQPLQPVAKEKISMFCHVISERVFSVHNVSSVYHVPPLLQSQRIVDYLRKWLNLPALNISKQMVKTGELLQKCWKISPPGRLNTSTSPPRMLIVAIRQERLFNSISVVLFGKYTDLRTSRDIASRSLVPSGFGVWGTQGMLLTIKYAREQKIPFLGICLGFQPAVIEWARNVLGITSIYLSSLACLLPSLIADGMRRHYIIGVVLNTLSHVIMFMPEISKTHM
ncbi:CTP synthase N-terminus-domain-containing protein [Mycena albidolilacea]|uniref:CTP synthase n=1 Tax=Mycena albidolilacea TaxID=1033008 RepID=A0AAD7AW16_9AGAR|nr:CTP synthase N-terminus-domain-containing protein [Mycena albidolilacea]